MEVFDRFWLEFTPKLFEWLGWVALLAGARFIQEKSPNILLGMIIWLCHVGILFYFSAYFSRFRFSGIPWIHSSRGRWITSLILSGALAYVAYLAAVYVSIAFTNGQP